MSDATSHFDKGIQYLIIVPDNILHNVPFEALLQTLPSSEAPRFLITRYAITYVPSAQVFSLLTSGKQPKPAIKTKQTLLAVADPNYEGAYLNKIRSSYELNEPLGKLQYSRLEIQNIKKIPVFTFVELMNDTATETRLKKALDSEYNFLHFAVHGILNSREPGLSGLLLLPGSDLEDGILQLFEVEKLKIKADLVFLSACNSASGKIYSGEGIIGLSTAFIQAGASRVIGTMWTIDDYSTSILVKDFYNNLLKNEYNYASALQNAQLNLLKQTRYNHPYYWASFRLIGIQ
jgi:CHAT domain-containing protein